MPFRNPLWNPYYQIMTMADELRVNPPAPSPKVHAHFHFHDGVQHAHRHAHTEPGWEHAHSNLTNPAPDSES